jgi:peptidoglycan/LPS O-acetylase OafA/YrhL
MNPGAEVPVVNNSCSHGTPVGKRLGILDDFRGMAAILVFLGHCDNFVPTNLAQAFMHPENFAADVFSGKVDLQTLISFIILFPFRLGWSAVPMFFVISGFCIHLTYCQAARPSLREFYVRRFFRIYPPYLVAVLFFGILFPWSRLPLTKLTYWAQLLTHLLLCHNVSDFFVWAISPAYWTIAVEVQLYLLFPLLLLYARRFSYRQALVLLAVIELSLHATSILAFDLHGQVSPAWLRTSPFFYWFSWALGAALADAYLNRAPLPFLRIHPTVWLAPWLLTSTWPGREFSFTFFALFTASVLARYLRAESHEERRSYLGRFVRRTGLYSYSVYLLHEPILGAVVSIYLARFPGMANYPLLIFAAGVSSWLVVYPLAAAMYYWVEKPGIKLGKRVLGVWSSQGVRQVETGVTSTA